MKTKKIIRVLALLMAVALMGSVVGCGNVGTTASEVWEEEIITISGTNNTTNDAQNNSSNNQTSTTNVATSTASNGTDANTPSASGNFDLGGKSVILAGWNSGFEPQQTSTTYKEEIALVAEIEKKYNCKITYNNASESLLQFSAWATQTLAGQRYADIIMMASDQYFPQCALRGFLTQLDGRIDLNNNCWIADVFDKTALKGKHYYAAPSSSALSLAGGGMAFNKDVFAKFNLKTPYQYVEEGNWNWNTFRDLAVAATRNEGGVQYYGLASVSGATFIGSNGGATSYMKDGKAVFGLDTPQALEAIEFARKLYNDDKICPTANGDALFKDGKVAMKTSSWYGMVQDGLLESMGESLGYTYMPIGNNVKDYYYHGGGINFYGVTNLAIDPDACAAIMQDWFGTKKWRETTEQIAENFCPDETAVKVMVDCVNRAMADMELVGFYDWYHRNVVWTSMGVDKNISAKAYVDSIKARSQEEIDSIWNLLDDFQ